MINNIKFNKIIEISLELEGGYSNHESDSGGKTMFGITKKVARNYGYKGDMKDLKIYLAKEIYYKNYYKPLKIDLIRDYSLSLKLFDFGINAGINTSIRVLQQAVNMVSNGSPLKIDGLIGPKTLGMLNTNSNKKLSNIEFLFEIGKVSHYFNITKYNEKNEDFIIGWIDKRTTLKKEKIKNRIKI